MSQTTINARTNDPNHEPDAVGAYLNEIGATELLTADDEVVLAKRIEVGLYAAELLRQHEVGDRDLTPAERRELATVAREGRGAKDRMIQANLRLVVSVAKKLNRGGLPLGDVIQEGNLGLIRAVEKFDYAKGFKFSTYATWWIRQAIGRGVADQSRVVRVPVHVSEQLNKFSRLERKLGVRLGREPSLRELADEAGETVEKIAEMRRSTRDAISLDVPVGDDGDANIGDLIEDADTVPATEVVEQRALTGELRSLLGRLSERRARIIELRFGLRDGHLYTLQQVADRVGLTRERVRQLEKQAMRELRDCERDQQRLLEWVS